MNPLNWVQYIILLVIIFGIVLLVIVVFPLIFRVLLSSVATMRRDILELRLKNKNRKGEMLCSPVESTGQAEKLKSHSWGKRVSRKLSSWSLAFSLTHTLIFHSHVSIVYGSTCSLSVFSYKCSDMAKAFRQCSNSPRTSLSKTMGLKFSKNVAIHWHSE